MANEDYDFEGAREGGLPRCTAGTYRCRIDGVQMGESTREDLDPCVLYTVNFTVLEVLAGGGPTVIQAGELEDNPPPGPVLAGSQRKWGPKIDGKKNERYRAQVLRFIQAVCGFKSDHEAAAATGDDGKPINWNQEIKDAAKESNPLEGEEFVVSFVRQIATKSKRAFYVPSFQPASK